MTLSAKFWRNVGWTVAAVSVIVNGGGAVYALLRQEWMHGAAHVVALVITVYLVQIFRARGTADESSWVDESLPPASPGDVRMEQLQQSVDAIAIEVERIGEAQRFNAKLAAKQGEELGERR